jgi:hypothetical protein
VSSADPEDDMPDHTSQYDPDRGPRDRSLRAADSDRHAVAALLREHHVAGRLDNEELEGRIARAVAAKTHADLDALLVDLPRAQDPARRAPRALRPPALARVVPLLLVAAIALAVIGGHAFWLAIPIALFVMRPLIWRATGVHGRWAGGCGGRLAGREGV